MRTRLSSKGQIVVPKQVRDRQGWEVGFELEIEEVDGGVIVRLPQNSGVLDIEDLVGCTEYRGPKRTQKQMERAIQDAVRARR